MKKCFITIWNTITIIYINISILSYICNFFLYIFIFIIYILFILFIIILFIHLCLLFIKKKNSIYVLKFLYKENFFDSRIFCF